MILLRPTYCLGNAAVSAWHWPDAGFDSAEDAQAFLAAMRERIEDARRSPTQAG